MKSDIFTGILIIGGFIILASYEAVNMQIAGLLFMIAGGINLINRRQFP